MGDHFECERIPASSMTCGSDFKNLIARILNKKRVIIAGDFVHGYYNRENDDGNVAEGSKNDVKIDDPIEQQCRFSGDLNLALPGPIICPACSNGDFRTAVYKCLLCNTPVHILDRCSVAFYGEEEGSEEKRMCLSCYPNEMCPLFGTIMLSREPENLGSYENTQPDNITVKKTKKSVIQNNFLKSDFTGRRKVTQKIILKNANLFNGKTYKIDGIKFSMQNTCAFDSFVQLFLNIIRNHVLRDVIVAWDTEFSNFVVKLFDSGILSNTYNKRASILLHVMPGKSLITKGETFILHCETSASELGALLFKEHPFAFEETVCSKCSRKNIVPMTSIAIEFSEFKSHLNEEIETLCRPRVRPCYNNLCNGSETTKIKITGPFLLLDIYTADTLLKNIKATEIPQKINISSIGKTFKLEGFISYKAHSRESSRRGRFQMQEEADCLALSTTIRHYTTNLIHNNNEWTEVCDVSVSETPLENMFVVPHIVIYTEVQNLM